MSSLRGYLPENYHSFVGKILRYISMFLLDYHWARHTGYVEGIKRARYFEGYADGQSDVHKFYGDTVLPRVRKWGYKKMKVEEPTV